MTVHDRATDVVIVGLGGMGGIAAHVLTEAGAEVVALEAGPWIAPEDLSFDEIRNDMRDWMAEPKAKHEAPTWRERESDVAGPSPWPILMANAVGGATVHYECVSVRFHPWDFRPLSNTIERYGREAIPEGATAADWPLSYDDLEPYYDRTEHAIGVSGVAGRIGDTVLAGGDPFEGPRTRDYPMGPLRSSGWNELMSTAAGELGWHPFPAPAAINTDPGSERGVCTYCGFCRNNGCHVNAKGSTVATVIPLAQQTGRLRIETGARVVAIETGDDGRATGVRYVKDGVEHFQPARAVLLGTFVYENVRLLLLSKSAAFPNGLANDHGQVGKHYMAHTNAYAFGRFPGRRLNLFSGTMAQGTCLNDYSADHFDHSEAGFVGGGMLSAWGELKPIQIASSRAVPPGVPRWGSEWKRWLSENGSSIGAVSSQFDALPYKSNYLDLDPTVKDPYGLPVVRVTHQLRENERRACEFLAEKLQLWLRQAGADETWAYSGQIEARHAYGGTRMGPDPETSVVDGFGFAHSVPNLGVLGASVFPSAGGYNPTLTAQALSWRTAEHLVANFNRVSA